MQQNRYASPVVRRAVILLLSLGGSIVWGVIAGAVFTGLVFAGEFMAPFVRKRPEWLLLFLLVLPVLRLLGKAAGYLSGMMMPPVLRWKEKRAVKARERQMARMFRRRWLGKSGRDRQLGARLETSRPAGHGHGARPGGLPGIPGLLSGQRDNGSLQAFRLRSISRRNAVGLL